MYRVLIVDDEPWVAYGIARLIDWRSEGFEVVGEELDGVDALRRIREERPDVVISDIRMPGLDGIELLEEIRRLGGETEVVLVSGYSEFEYAQRALRLGAFDYLLKQIDKNQLRETMARLRERLERKRLDALEADAQLGELFELLDSDAEATIGTFYAGREKALYPHYRIVNAVGSDPSAFGGAKSALRTEGLCGFALRTGQQKTTFLLNYDEERPLALLDYLENRLSGAASVGISTPDRENASLARLYREADIALYTSLFYPELRLVRYRETETFAGASGILLRLELGIREQKTGRVRDCLRELEEACIRQQPDVQQVADVYNQIVAVLHKYYGHEEAFPGLEYLTYDQLGRVAGSAESLFERIRTLVDREAAPDVPIVHEQVKSVMAYIDQSFAEEDVSLGAIAKRFNLSLAYLSYLIKKETGKTYMEYIASKRIALSKELLADASLSVQEIVQRVGYKDYFHFNKLFKKHVGVTPSKFRKL